MRRITYAGPGAASLAARAPAGKPFREQPQPAHTAGFACALGSLREPGMGPRPAGGDTVSSLPSLGGRMVQGQTEQRAGELHCFWVPASREQRDECWTQCQAAPLFGSTPCPHHPVLPSYLSSALHTSSGKLYPLGRELPCWFFAHILPLGMNTRDAGLSLNKPLPGLGSCQVAIDELLSEVPPHSHPRAFPLQTNGQAGGREPSRGLNPGEIPSLSGLHLPSRERVRPGEPPHCLLSPLKACTLFTNCNLTPEPAKSGTRREGPGTHSPNSAPCLKSFL